MGSEPGYDIRITHFRDIYGKFLFSEEITDANRIYQIGETFPVENNLFKIQRVAIADNIQHVNVEIVEERVNIVEPYL